MITRKAFCFVLGCAVVLSSCAGTYRPVYPASLEYSHNSASPAPVNLGYRYDVLAMRGNKKHARKEEKKSLMLMAVEVTNNTNRPLVFGKDIQLANGSVVVNPLPSAMVYSQLKQQAPLFLLYLLLTPAKLTFTKSEGPYVTQQTNIPIGIALGPGLALGNMLTADGNNKKFQAELMQHDLVGKIIQPGETVYGLVGVGHTGYGPLTARLVDDTAASQQATE